MNTDYGKAISDILKVVTNNRNGKFELKKSELGLVTDHVQYHLILSLFPPGTQMNIRKKKF